MEKRSAECMPDEALLNDLAQPFPDQRITLPDGEIEFVPAKGGYVVANPALPINQCRDQIAGYLDAGKSFIVATATGSGKTLELPKIAHYDIDKYNRVYITQPTVLGARNAAARLAVELTALGAAGDNVVGYQTANEGTLNENHKIAYVTPKLYAEMLLSGAVGKDDLSVLDEFHMRQVGTDLAFSLNHTHGIQTVISSATIDTELIARRAREMTGQDYPIIVGPGRRYDIDERVEPVLVSQAIINLVEEFKKAGKAPPKIAVLLPGDQAIRDIRGAIQKRLPNDMPIFRLTGESSRDHQEKATADYAMGSVILATNVIETSFTIRRLNAIVDSLYRRTGHYRDGVKRLPLEIASLASQDQCTGRVGRTMPGISFQAMLDGFPVAPVFLQQGQNAGRKTHVIKDDDTPAYGRPEIESIDLSDIEIRLAVRDMTLGRLSLLTEPKRHAIEGARSRLRRIEALQYGTGDITDIGREMAKLNIDTSYARMVVEATSRGKRTGLQMIAAVSALQVKGIGASGMNHRRWLELTEEKNSDVLAQLDIMLAAMSMSNDEKASFDIIDHRFDHAMALAKTLADRLGMDFAHVAQPTDAERDVLIDCAITGYQEVFVRNGKRTFRGQSERRVLTGSSVILTRAKMAQLVMAEAVDIGVMHRQGPRIRRVLKTATAVNITTLDRVVPQKISRRLVGYDMSRTGKIYGVQEVYFENTRIGKTQKHIAANDETDSILIKNVCEKRRIEGNHPDIKALYSAIDGLKELQDRTDQDLNLEKLDTYLLGLLSERAPKSILSIDKLTEVIVPKDVAAYIPAHRREEILAQAPSNVDLALMDDTTAVFDVTYLRNVAYVHVLPQHVSLLPDDISVNGRKTLLRIQGVRNMLTVAKAKEHFGRESRWYRRGGESDSRATFVTSLTAETAAEVAGRVAISIQAQKAEIIITKHFNTKKVTPGKKHKKS